MKNSRSNTQGGFVKVLLLLISIPIIAGVSILGYIFIPALLKNSEPWEKRSGAPVRQTETKRTAPSSTPANSSDTSAR